MLCCFRSAFLKSHDSFYFIPTLNLEKEIRKPFFIGDRLCIVSSVEQFESFKGENVEQNTTECFCFGKSYKPWASEQGFVRSWSNIPGSSTSPEM